MGHLILSIALLMQVPEGRSAIDDVERARTLADQQQWDQSIKVLARAQQRCGPQPAGNDCLSRVLFTRGYVHASRAAAEPSVRERELSRAEEAYTAVEQMMPADTAVLRNLALVLAERGKWSGAVGKLERAAEADAGQRGSYFLEAAEVCRDFNRNEDAVKWYGRAAESGAGDQAWPRLISLLADQIQSAEPSASQNELLKRLRVLGDSLFDGGRSDLAASAYERVIGLAPQSAQAIAEEALIRWADLRAQSGPFDEVAIRRLSAAPWRSQGISELLAVTENPDAPQVWWRSSQLRRHTWSAVLTSLAAGFVKTDPKRAARLYERAIENAPYPPEYDSDTALQRRSIVFLDAATQLARLLTSNKGLDPTGARFSTLEDHLFNGKAFSYKMKNLAATQKTHAVLGLIYADRGKWTGGQYTNATFQLRLALDEAAEREEKEGILLPLPHLNELLGDGYKKQGNSRESRKQLLAAAKAYLDVDALDRATKVIERAKEPAGSVPDPLNEQLIALQSIADFRKRIATLPLESIQDFAPPATAVAGDQAFLARQRFKMLADAAQRAEAAGKPDASRDLYLRALDSVKEQKSLAGTGDVLRLERIQGSVRKSVKIDTKDISESGSKAGKVWQLPETTTAAAAQQVVWSPDLLLAARVAAMAGPDQDVVLSVKNAEVVVAAPPSKSAAAQTTANRLRAAGVAKVSTAPTPP